MTIGEWTTLVGAVVSFVQALSWPLIVLYVLIRFGAPIKRLLDDVGEFTLKAGASGFEATVKKQQAEAAALLGIASANKQRELQDGQQVTSEDQAREIADVLAHVVTPRTTRRLAGASVLWVDDMPSNNIYERKSLEALGIGFETSTSTEDALDKIRRRTYDAIISDMSRPPDHRAGYTLLEELRKQKLDIPFVIYAGSNRPEHKAEARRRGAWGNTNSPQELFQLVTSAIQNS